MNRKLILSLAVVMVLLGSAVIASCAPKPAPPPVPAPAPPPAPKPPPPAPAPAPPPAPPPAPKPPPAPAPAPPPVIKWKVVSPQPKADPRYWVMEEVAKLVKEMSGGRLIFEVFTGGEIVPATKEVHATHEGVIDASFNPTVWQIDLVPTGGLFFQMAGGLTPVPNALWYFQGGGRELVREAYKALNVEVVTHGYLSTTEIWGHFRKPLKTAADLKGVKMRALGDPAAILARMGMTTMFLYGGEISEAMMRGVIDGFEMGAFRANYGMGFHEVAKYVYESPSRGPNDSNYFFANKKKWGELTPDLQKIVEAAAFLEGFKFYAKEVLLETEFKKKFRDYGNIVEPLPVEIEKAFLAEAKKYYDGISAKDPFYGKVVESAYKFKALCDEMGIR